MYLIIRRIIVVVREPARTPKPIPSHSESQGVKFGSKGASIHCSGKSSLQLRNYYIENCNYIHVFLRRYQLIVFPYPQKPHQIKSEHF